MTYNYEYLKKAVYDMTKIDLNAYKENQMKRRIDTLIGKHKINGYDHFVAALKSDKELFETLYSSADPAFWKDIENMERCLFHRR